MKHHMPDFYPQIINTVQAAERGSGLAVPPQDQLPAGPLGQYTDYVALMEVRARLLAHLLAHLLDRVLAASGFACCLTWAGAAKHMALRQVALASMQPACRWGIQLPREAEAAC